MDYIFVDKMVTMYNDLKIRDKCVEVLCIFGLLCQFFVQSSTALGYSGTG